MFKLQNIINEIEIEGFNNIYYFEFGKNFSHTLEKHNFWEMVYVDSGNVLALTDGNSCTLTQGQIIFHEPNEIHAHISDKHSPNNMFVISFTSNSEKMKFFKGKIFESDKTIKTLLSLFMAEAKSSLGDIPHEYSNKTDLNFSNENFASTQLLSCYFTELLINLIRNSYDFNNKIVSTEESRALSKSSVCNLIISYMEENLYSNLTLLDLCKHFMLGKSQLSHIFKTNIGQSPIEYYSNLKINEAKKLLRNDEYSVSQIADMLGYSCIHNFSRAFKKVVLISPTAYKKKIG